MAKRMEKNNNISVVEYEVDFPLCDDEFGNPIPWIVPKKPIKDLKTGKLIPQYEVDCMVLSDYIKSNLNYLFVRENAMGSRLIYVYNDGVYRLVNEEEFKGFIKSFIPNEIRRSKDINEIFFDISTEHRYISCEMLNNDEKYINFKNGLLNIETMQMEKHNPRVLSTIQIPVDYLPLKYCDKGLNFESYIDYLADGDDCVKNILLQCMGLVISNVYGYRTKKSLFLIGKHNTGKTQIKELLVKLIGIENVSSVDLERLNSQFGTSELYQKRLAGSNDMGYQTINDMAIFKQLTGGDTISIEFKGKGSFPYRFKGFLWYNTNAYPKFSGDKAKELYNRIIPIYCNHVVPKEKRDRHLLEKMYKERQYIVALCIEKLKELIDNDFEFVESEKIVKTREEYEVENNNLYMFVKDCCIVSESPLDQGERVTRKTFRLAYTRWCDSNSYRYKVNDNDLMEYLSQKYGTRLIKSSGYYKLDNIKLTYECRQEFNIYNDE